MAKTKAWKNKLKCSITPKKDFAVRIVAEGLLDITISRQTLLLILSSCIRESRMLRGLDGPVYADVLGMQLNTFIERRGDVSPEDVYMVDIGDTLDRYVLHLLPHIN